MWFETPGGGGCSMAEGRGCANLEDREAVLQRASRPVLRGLLSGPDTLGLLGGPEEVEWVVLEGSAAISGIGADPGGPASLAPGQPGAEVPAVRSGQRAGT